MDLQHSITKAFSVAAFFGLTLAPQSRGVAGSAGPLHVAASHTPAASVGTAQPTSSAASSGPCGERMILVEGDACPSAEQVCLKWLDPPPYQNLRCGEYAKPAKCKVPRVHRRFCIDREEFAEPSSPGSDEVMPRVNTSWGEAKALCEARGARLCKEAEWEFACEGPEMSPYPYGWKRDSEICNFDKKSLGGAMSKLKDLRAPESAYPECLSPFGVHNMVGNVDEWVERERMSPPNRSALRGGWWLPGRNRCRAATLAHGEDYSAKQVGFRCCKDAQAAR
ncbi:MAG: SUMF1/EgtB/PvdO family nonheme iron enzyme [Labilithrix sp.]|nr:SUMF1/EgtB/PvdO family nonheme iron enzyme [Labilithrix sp.]